MEGQKGLFAFSDAIPFLLFDQEDENARGDLLPCQHCLVGSGLVCLSGLTGNQGYASHDGTNDGLVLGREIPAIA